MLLLEARPPTKRSALRWTAVPRLHFLEPHVVLQGSQGALNPCGPGYVPDGHHREALVPHMLMQSLPMRKAPGGAASTHKKKVKMPLHMAEGSVRVLVNNSTVGTKGQLPLLALNVQRLPHQAPMSVEACQQKLLVHTTLEFGRHYSHQAGCS